MGCLCGRHPAFQISFDVFDHDDGVVDDDADRKHQPEQRKIVEGDPDRVENRESADEGHRDRNHRNDRGPPALEKQEDHAHNQKDRNEDRRDDFVDGFSDEDGRIVDNFMGDAGRKIL